MQSLLRKRYLQKGDLPCSVVQQLAMIHVIGRNAGKGTKPLVLHLFVSTTFAASVSAVNVVEIPTRCPTTITLWLKTRHPAVSFFVLLS